MSFKSPARVRDVVEAMRTADEPRAYNRARINWLFNGEPPYTEDQRRENRIQHNVNFLEGPNIAHAARRQLYNAFLKPGYYFTVSLDKGPAHLRRTWSRIITININRTMKRSMAFTEAMRSTHAQLVLHGIGPRLWEDRQHWCPYAYGVEDVLVPSGTLVSMRDLAHFAVYRRYTAYELYQATHGKRVDKGWNVPLADRIVAALSKEPVMATSFTDWRFPEKLAEDIKENGGYYGSDAVAKVNCWDFYYREAKTSNWHRKILLDGYNPSNASVPDLPTMFGAANKEFLYDPKERVEAEALAQLLHVQFADCSSVAPFRYHCVRSLGYLLYNICHLQNRYRCQITDAQMMELLWFFRNVPEEDREKLLSVQLYHMGIIPQGVDFVTGPERYHPDPNLILMGLQQNRQLMSENSASFVQDIAGQREEREETATLTMAKINNASAMISSMLNLAYIYETQLYREVARRFCTTRDPDCVAFRKRCQTEGVPEEAFDVEAWDIEPERVLGAGNKTLEIAQADRLMAVYNRLDPEAQRLALHIYVEANTDDPNLTDVMVPINTPERESVSRSAHEANLAMGTLMLGLPVPVPRDVAAVEYVEVLLLQLDALTKGYEQAGGMVEEDTLRGLVNVAQHIRQLIAQVAQDENEKQRVKEMMDVLGAAENLIKAFAQRLAEAREAQQQQMDPETMAKVQAIVATAQAKVQAGQATNAQKLQQKDAAFRQKLGQQAVRAQFDLAARTARTQADVGEKRVRVAADLEEQAAEMRAEQAKHEHQLLMDQEAHEVELAREREKAATEGNGG